MGALLGVGLLVAGCGGAAAGGPGPTSGVPGEANGEVVVLAAASLTESFNEIADDFEAANPGTSVTLGFDASSTLAQQIVAGAPADVFASADTATMSRVVGAGAAEGNPAVFARNRLEIATPAGNPGQVRGLADFADQSRRIAVCAPEVPCGAAAVRAFDAAHVGPRPDTLEQDVKAVLTKVQLGEVDAGLVYRTDVTAAGAKVEGIAFPESAQAVNDYPIVTLADAPNPAGADAFAAYVRSEAGQRVLRAAGFGGP